MKRTVLITGASSGIGKASTKLFAAKGWNVVATMRSPEKETELTGLADVLVTRLDVQDEASIRAAVGSVGGSIETVNIMLREVVELATLVSGAVEAQSRAVLAIDGNVSAAALSAIKGADAMAATGRSAEETRQSSRRVSAIAGALSAEAAELSAEIHGFLAKVKVA